MHARDVDGCSGHGLVMGGYFDVMLRPRAQTYTKVGILSSTLHLVFILSHWSWWTPSYTVSSSHSFYLLVVDVEQPNTPRRSGEASAQPVPLPRLPRP